MKAKKPWVSWEEFEQIVGGNWAPGSHSHVKTDITDTPWAWADVSKAGSNLTDLATRQHAGLTGVTSDQHHAQLHAASHNLAGGDELNHDNLAGFVGAEHLSLPNSMANVINAGHTKAAHDALGLSHDSLADVSIDDHHAQIHATEHEVGGGDLLAFAGITGFGDWLDQAVKQASAVSFAGVTDTGTAATNIAAGTTGQRPGGVVGDMRYNSTLGAFEVYPGSWKSMKLSGDAPTAHAASHLVGAGDALSVGVPVSIGVALLEGTATNFARRDHVHTHPSGLGADKHHPQLHEAEHRVGGGDALHHDNLEGFVVSEHTSLPNTIVAVLSDHDKAAHDALNIDADTVDGEEAANIVTKARVDALGASHDSLADVSIDDHHAQIHATEHEVGGGDLLAFAGITGFGDWLDQAVKQASSPTFVTAKLSGLTDGYIPYHVDDATGLADSPIINFGGNIGINVADPDEQLEVNGNIKADTFLLAAGVTPNLGWLSDVTLGTLEEGETIRYDQATTKWIDAWGIDYDNPRLVYKIYTDFFTDAGDSNDPWVGAGFGGGGCTAIAGTSNHPGIVRLSSNLEDAGYRWMTATNCILIAGAEHSEFCFRTGASLINFRVRLGFQDSINEVAPTDGVYINALAAILTGKTRNNGAESTTGTDYTLVANTWYRGKIAVNSDATEVVFILYSAAGVVLWTDTLAANIPTAAGRETGHGIVMFVGADVARTFDVDMMIATRAGYITR